MQDERLVFPSLKEFYENPSGKGITANNITAVKNDFKMRYKYLLDRKLKIVCKVYKESETSFYFHLIIPSQKNLNTYDVVIHLSDSFSDGSNGNLKNYNIQLFSNCPSFIFTYATAYNEQDLMIKFLANKLERKVLTNLPAIRNPDMVVGYDKSIFFACHYLMTDIRFTQRFYLNRIAEPFDVKKLHGLIRNEEQIMDECETHKVQKVNIINVGSNKGMTDKTIDGIKEIVKKSGLLQREDKSNRDKNGKTVDIGKQIGISASKPNRNKDGKIVARSKVRATRTSRKN